MKLSPGTVHPLSIDLKSKLWVDDTARIAWNDITPLARNEFICWVESAKQPATRQRRIARTIQELNTGKRRPCCWAGCPHRARSTR